MAVSRLLARLAAITSLAFLAACADPAAQAATTVAAAPSTRPIWHPRTGITWQWQLDGKLDLTVPAAVYDVDLVDTPAATVAALHRSGRKVVCYFSAGTWEDWRPDAARYPQGVRGAALEAWPGERWLDIRKLDVLRPLIAARLDLCRAKGFDGAEPDNVDAYANRSGFALTAADQLRFNRLVASLAHARGLSVALKNDLDQAATLAPYFDFAVVEQCVEYAECDHLQPFVASGKAVLAAEYTGSTSRMCTVARRYSLSAIRKRLSLDASRTACPPLAGR